MSITATDVKKLRDMTGAGMMDSKKALLEAEGDFESAIEILRKKGQKLSAKRADREANEGVVIAKISHNKNRGVVIRLSCETDFVAKNQDFIDLAEGFAAIALKELPDSIEDLLEKNFDGITIGKKIEEQVGVIGEKIALDKYEKIVTSAGQGQVLPYIHMGYKAGVIVAVNMEGTQFEEPAKNVAMQVAAMKPIALNSDGVDAKIVQKEIEIGKEQARAQGKPEAIIEKIAMGKLNKFYKERTLLAQQYVKNSSFNVESYLHSIDKKLTVTDYKHIALG